MEIDYKKKYEDALERARKAYNHSIEEGWNCDKGIYESIFPELKESEDERIRKDLIKAINTYIQFADRPSNEIISWLERQGEQKKFNEDEFLREHITKDSISDIVNSRLTKCGWYVSESKWSEDDEKYINDILAILGGGRGYRSNRQIEEWLKSLKPQNHWKPTKEQLDEISYAIYRADCYGYEENVNILQSLYEQLKKL